MYRIEAYVCMGQLHWGVSVWRPDEGGATHVHRLGGGEVPVGDPIGHTDEDVVALLAECLLDAAYGVSRPVAAS